MSVTGSLSFVDFLHLVPDCVGGIFFVGEWINGSTNEISQEFGQFLVSGDRLILHVIL